MKVNQRRKYFFTFILSLFPVVSFSYVNITQEKNSTIYDVAVDDLKIENRVINGEEFSSIKLLGVDGLTGVNYEIGAPEVPVVRLNVAADNANAITVNTRTFFDYKSVETENELIPVMDSVEKIKGAKFKIQKSEIYSLNSDYPTDAYRIRELGQIRGEKQFEITLFPVQLESASHKVKITRSYQVVVNNSQKLNGGDQGTREGIVFVVGQKFKQATALQNYMAKKAALGLEVFQIDASALNADQIRTKIQALYGAHKNLKYVVLVGDLADVDSKVSQHINGVTDHYYASIDTRNYESDIATPDLFVGRISASSVEELNTILLKYTRYINGDFASRGWINHTSFLATNDQWQLAEGTHNYVIDSYTKSRGYTGSFPTEIEPGGDKLYAITNHADNRQVMEAFVKGRSIIDYSGHGATTFWDAPRVSQSDVRSLNSSSLPFVISNACITGDFRLSESFAETWQRTEWGAVMFWGSMDSTYWDEDDILEKKMFDGVFQNSNLTFGSITQFALVEMGKHYGGQGRTNYYFETYHMFGDPSISLRLK